MMGLVRAIRDKVAERREQPFRFPDHIERVPLNMGLLALSMSHADKENPAVDVRSISKKTPV